MVEPCGIELQTFALRTSLLGPFLTVSGLFHMPLTLMHIQAPLCTGTNAGQETQAKRSSYVVLEGFAGSS